MSPDLAALSVADLLRLHARTTEELVARGVCRTANNPVGDYAEHLFCRAFGWQIVPNSVKGYDAADAEGRRYQIKARRLTARNGSRQLSPIRGLDDDHFDQLAAVLFDRDFAVAKAAIIPRQLVAGQSRYSSHVNGHLFILRDSVWTVPGVRDVTAELAAAQSSDAPLTTA